ncbi:DUF2207 family protein [Microbacterium sp. A588]
MSPVLLLITIGIIVVPVLILLALAIVARVQSHRLPKSPGPRFAPEAEGTVIRDALLLNQDRRAMAAALVDLAIRRKVRLLRPAAEDGKRAAISVETVEGASFTASEVAVLEALFGRESASERVRRFSSDSRLLGRRVRAVLDTEEHRGVSAGLIAQGRCAWPVVLLRIFAAAGVLCSLIWMLGTMSSDTGTDWLAFSAALAGFLVVLAVFFVIPRPWRRFTREAEPLRAHLAGMREYIDLAEKEPLRFLQSVQGALPSADVSAAARHEGLERFLLNERMLPYAVLFGMEKSWLAALGEHAGELRSTGDLGDIGDIAEAAFEVLAVIELVGGVLQLVRSVGELADAAGSAAEFVGGVFDALP